jgi:hypothetical protein
MKNEKTGRIIIVLAGLAVIAGAIFLWHLYFGVANTQDFIRAYQTYAVVSQEYKVSAYTPGAEKNTVRQELNTILAQVLDEKISSKNRLSFAESGLIPLAEIRGEIDAIKEKGKVTDRAILLLREKAGDLGGLRVSNKAAEVITIAEERTDIIREIETVSYRMNDTISDIFKGIIQDKGELTQKRIRSLNEKIPAAEKDFERLSEQYRALEKISQKIDAAFVEFQNFSV